MSDINYGNILEALNDKTDRDMGNLSNAGKIVSAKMSMPSNIYDDLTLGVSGASYAAPADGWVVLHATQNTLNGYVFLRNATGGELTSYGQPTTTNNFVIRTFIPVAKTQTIIIDYSGITSTLFRFVYAVGSKSEQ